MEFWKQVTIGTVLAAVSSCFQVTDIEIHWPLLLTYFLFMTIFLCRFKLEHMLRYKYLPFEFGKKKYSKQEA